MKAREDREGEILAALVVILAALLLKPERFRDVFRRVDRSRSDWLALTGEWVFNADDRKMFEMRYLDGMTHEEVAEAMSLSVDRVKARTKNVEQTLLKHM